MALSEVKRRLRKFQKEARQAGEITPAVADIIREGRYYDELTPQEQDEVIAYWGTDRDTFEVFNGVAFNNYSLHFQIKKKTPAPRNRKELDERLEEINKAMEEEYNSPEAKAQREAEYQELQRLGELRKMDFLCGRDMDKEHPLPWAEKDREDRERWERFEQERKEIAKKNLN